MDYLRLLLFLCPCHSFSACGLGAASVFVFALFEKLFLLLALVAEFLATFLTLILILIIGSFLGSLLRGENPVELLIFLHLLLAP